MAVALYDTGRLVALAPWLAGHDARVEFLCARQSADGGWGGSDGYAVVPTLSVTAALLAELRRDGQGSDRERLAHAATGGLHALRRWLDPVTGLIVPDTIAVELIVPALVDEINALLTPDLPLPGVAVDARPWLRLPQGFDRQLLEATRVRFAAGALPQRAWACLEVLGEAATAAPFVRPAAGVVGCSAAATAAWLGGSSGDLAAAGFLDALQARGGGPVPAVTPITYFEPAWVLNSLAVGGFAPAVPASILDRLEAGLTPTGVPAAPGLPADADDTAAVLAALLRHGRVHSPESLLGYLADGYFKCFPDERNPSVSTNAHVLEALALYLGRRPQDRARFATPAQMAARWLLDQQRADGSWLDKWHASPYYATACCILALVLHDSAGTRESIDRAVDWVLDTQRPDGSWGRWQGTVEETSYAVQVLTLACPPDKAAAIAVKRGCAYLADHPVFAEHPPLWHAKDLYAPIAVIQAARLAALRLGDGVGELVAAQAVLN